MADRNVEEIHAIRRTLCEECDFDFQKLGEYFMRLQDEDPFNLVDDVPRTKPEPEAKTHGE